MTASMGEKEVLITASANRCRETLDRIWKPGRHAMANNGLVGNLSASGKINPYRCPEHRDLSLAVPSGGAGSLFGLVGGIIGG